MPVSDFANGHRELNAFLHEKFQRITRYNEIQTYLLNRHYHIQDRFLQSERYLDLDPQNSIAYSYEYASLLRDVGSVFGSFLDKLIRSTSSSPINQELDINDYKRFLIKEINDIEDICAEINASYKQKYLFPFNGIKDPKRTLKWWSAYNTVKHSDVEGRTQGCLSNILYSLAALTILTNVFDPNFHFKNQIFQIGIYSDYKLDKSIILNQFTFPIDTPAYTGQGTS